MSSRLIYGINPVIEALRAGRVTALQVTARSGGRMREVLVLAQQQGVPVQRSTPDELARRTGGGVHQGVIAEVTRTADLSIGELVSGARGVPLFVVLDGIEDPHNLGAILRTSEAAGVDGVVVQDRRSAALGGTAAKASAGAIEYIRLARVVNIARALVELQGAGIWTVGLAGEADDAYGTVDFTLPTAIVLGAEDSGVRRLVREQCDRLVRIPMRGRVGSLNVSVAAGVVLFEAVRQRAAAAVAAERPT